MRFLGRTALITGGGTGIGAAVARRFAADGGRPVVFGRRRENVERIASETGGLAVAGDAASDADVKRAVRLATEAFGGLDALVANAGGGGFGPLVSTSDEDWREAARSNLDTLFVCARECMPSLIERAGNVVVVSSMAGLFALPEGAGYVAAKHGCIGLGRSLAADYGRRGVRTNIVCPGWVRTPMADEEMRGLAASRGFPSMEEAYDLVTADVPLRKAAEPDDVANLVCFLASDEARMMNGAVCNIDGGASVVDLATLAFIR